MKDTIRQANLEDVRPIAEFMKRFEKESSFVQVDVDHTTHAYSRLVALDNAVLLILERDGEMIGGLGYVMAEDLHSGKKTATETYWLVDRRCRGGGLRLLRMFEESARDNGCVRVNMVHMVDSHPEILSKLYAKRGYRLAEKCYTKGL